MILVLSLPGPCVIQHRVVSPEYLDPWHREGGAATFLQAMELMSGDVHLGNHCLLVILEVISQQVPHCCQSLTVA